MNAVFVSFDAPGERRATFTRRVLAKMTETKHGVGPRISDDQPLPSAVHSLDPNPAKQPPVPHPGTGGD